MAHLHRKKTGERQTGTQTGNPLAPKARKQNCESIPTVNLKNWKGRRAGGPGGGAPPMVVGHSNTSLPPLDKPSQSDE